MGNPPGRSSQVCIWAQVLQLLTCLPWAPRIDLRDVTLGLCLCRRPAAGGALVVANTRKLYTLPLPFHMVYLVELLRPGWSSLPDETLHSAEVLQHRRHPRMH